MKAASLSLFVLLSGIVAQAQSTQPLDPAIAERLRARQEAFSRAARHVADDRAELAEDVLGAVATANPGTGEWRLQVAAGLVRTAYAMRESGEDQAQAKSIKAAARALQLLEQAERKLGADAGALANIWELRASIYEGLWGDSHLAFEAYRRALALAPASEGLRANVQRLERQLAGSEG